MTTVSNRPAPDGYTEEWDSEGWNVGFIFRWSDVYDDWLDCGVVVTVKPGQTLSEAFEDRINHPMWEMCTIFFSDVA